MVNKIGLALLFLAAKPITAYAASKTIRVPGGIVPSTCVFSADGKGGEVSEELARKLEACNAASSASGATTNEVGATQQIYAMDVHVNKSSYWTNFTANWVVPELPNTAKGQVNYFWPGFKSEQPEMGYPVLQPVLQYGQHGGSWELQSWFVHGGAVTGDIVKCERGDAIESYMSYNPATTLWTVYGKNVRSGEESILTISKQRLGGYDFDWAMVVYETIMDKVDYCDELPASDAISFTAVLVDGESNIEWTEREQLDECDQKVTANAKNQTVDMTWDHTLSSKKM